MANMKNPGIVIVGPRQHEIFETGVPKISDAHDAIIRIAFGGVCGSDVHFWNDGAIDGNPVSRNRYLPLGHEASGTVVELGSAVQDLMVGDRVAIEPANPCRRCVRCREGQYNLCPGMKYAASSTENPGTLTKFFKVPADFCYRLPEHVTLEEGVMAEPLAVAAHQIRMANVRPGQSLVVFGAGTIGLLCAAVAKVYGATKIVLVDILQSKLDVAAKFVEGSVTYKTEIGADPEWTAQQVASFANLGLGADVVIEATGVEASTICGVFIARKGAQFVQTGVTKHRIQFPMFHFGIKELHLHGAFRHSEGDYRVAMHILENRLVPVKDLIRKIYEFEEVDQAWSATQQGYGIKNMVRGVRD